MDIGISTYAFAWSIGVPGFPPAQPFGVMDFIRRSADLQADCIQIADNIPLHEFSDHELMQLRAEAEKNQLKIEIGMRGLKVDFVQKYLQISKFLGSKLLRVVIDSSNYQPSIPSICAAIITLLPDLKSHKIVLAIENHDRFASDELIDIIQATDTESVGICLDSVNSLGKGEGFGEVFSKLLPYTINVHIKDYVIQRKSHQMGFDVRGVVAGQGMLPIPKLLAELAKLGRCESAILELWPPPEQDLQSTIVKEQQWAQASIQYLLKARG